ncbi:MAG: hypothetical protein RQ763_00580 [Sulfurimonas sp.]|uniref:hypothetical protein n=1 Tax=Sulfurimonas sp. TaxID=2022749 RepID=UPI0028CCF2CF|nr:hypothetical protein [Sulfurimonas sp.]MDT8337670.1 hypothetical protein [Sulfurimonas sp.]
MQKKTLFWLCTVSLLALKLSANEFPDRGFYGSLNFLYTDDNYINSGSENSKENFLQEYKLGYAGNIYSPRLLDYKIEALLRFDKEEVTRDTETIKQNSNGEDYKVNLNFIKDTNFPFTIYANKSERPINTVYSAYTTNYAYDTKSEGATGSLNFNPYMFTYGATTTKTTAEFRDRLQDTKTTAYSGSFRYSEGAHNMKANYLHSILDNEQNYINDEIISVSQTKDVLNLSHTWRASDDFTLNSKASYENDEYYARETIDAGVDLNWRPKEADYDAYLSVLGTTMEYGDSLGGQKYVFDSVNVNQRFNYRLTETITLSEGAMLFFYDSPTSKGSNSYVNLDATHKYDTTIFSDMPFNLTSRAGVQKNDSNIESIYDGNSTSTKTSTERYDISLNARAKKSFPKINSDLTLTSGYFHSLYSTDREEQRYNFGIYFLSKIFDIFNNNITARYTQTNMSAEPSADEGDTKSSYSQTNIMESLDFNFRLGVRGRVGFRVGAEYINTKSDAVSSSRVDPRAEANLNYRLFKNWKFDASARISEIYNTLEHSGNANLTFSAGKTTFLMGYQYNKSEIDSVYRTIENKRSIFRVQLTRTF